MKITKIITLENPKRCENCEYNIKVQDAHCNGCFPVTAYKNWKRKLTIKQQIKRLKKLIPKDQKSCIKENGL